MQCNEARPRCANCLRLDINCTWPEVNNRYSASPQTPPSPSPLAESPSQLPAGNFELSIPDMRLLHHWTTKGYAALHPRLANQTDLWQTCTVELGFQHTFLLHGILALSAVHKASMLLPGDRQALLLQADSHISQALDTMRKHLQAPTEETSLPMFVLSSVLLTYNFGSVQEKPEDAIGSVHHCFMLLNGIKVVIGPHWEKIKDDHTLGPMIETSSPETLQALDTLAGNDERSEIQRLMELTELVLDTQDKAACAEAITHLHYVAVRVRYISPDRDENPLLFMWAANCSNRFFDLLAAHNPVACIITVHFAALLAQTRLNWWLLKWPRWILAATEQLLAATPDLLEWLDWARPVINAASWTEAARLSSS